MDILQVDGVHNDKDIVQRTNWTVGRLNIDLIWHTGHWTGWTKSGLLPKWIVNTVDNDPQRTLDSIQIRPVQSGHRKNEQWALEKYTVDKTDMGKIHSGQDGHWKNTQWTRWTLEKWTADKVDGGHFTEKTVGSPRWTK